MRLMSTVVLPLPAPARMSSAPSVVSTASCCMGLSDAKSLLMSSLRASRYCCLKLFIIAALYHIPRRDTSREDRKLCAVHLRFIWKKHRLYGDADLLSVYFYSSRALDHADVLCPNEEMKSFASLTNEVKSPRIFHFSHLLPSSAQRLYSSSAPTGATSLKKLFCPNDRRAFSGGE